MALHAGAKRRSVLEEEEEAQGGEREAERERRDLGDAVHQAPDERRDDLRRVLLDAVGGARRARRVDPGVLEPALNLVGGVAGVSARLVGLRDDPPDHEQEHEGGHGHQCQENDRRPSCPRDAVPPEPADERRGDGCHHEGDDHRLGDDCRGAEEPDHAEEQRRNADEEPRREPEVAQPAWSRKDICKLVHADLDDVGLRRFLARVGGVALVPVESGDLHGRTM